MTRGDILDSGTLYVARFNDDGTGEWLPLVYGQNGLDESNGFTDQGDVLINTRTAADIVGATPMDRPEWGTVDPATRAVYFTPDEQFAAHRRTRRGSANPRAENRYGSIIRWNEADGDQESERFNWDFFVLQGLKATAGMQMAKRLTRNSVFACPDGLVDRLQTGGCGSRPTFPTAQQNQGPYESLGNNPDAGGQSRIPARSGAS